MSESMKSVPGQLLNEFFDDEGLWPAHRWADDELYVVDGRESSDRPFNSRSRVRIVCGDIHESSGRIGSIQEAFEKWLEGRNVAVIVRVPPERLAEFETLMVDRGFDYTR